MIQSLTDLPETTWPDAAARPAERAPEPSCAETDGTQDTETAPA